MMQEVEVAAVARVDPEAAWAWWTDFGREGEVFRVSHGMGATRRRILETRPDTVVMEDDLPVPGHPRVAWRRVTLDPEARVLREEGRGWTSYDATWRFQPDPSGTRIIRSLRPRGATRWAPAPLVRLAARVDLRHHVARMERDLGAGGDGRPPRPE